MSSNALRGDALAPAAPKRARQLRPEIAARLRAASRERQLSELYEKSVGELSPDEISRMKAAFFAAR